MKELKILDTVFSVYYTDKTITYNNNNNSVYLSNLTF